jgi:hypothetical protein
METFAKTLVKEPWTIYTHDSKGRLIIVKASWPVTNDKD